MVVALEPAGIARMKVFPAAEPYLSFLLTRYQGVSRQAASAIPIGVEGGAWVNGQISSEMRRQSAVADS
jgi:hypothetical protein